MKSHESDLIEILECIFRDVYPECAAINSHNRDLITIRSRVEREGISFLTITLPAFCVDFERSLALGFVKPTFFQGFRKNGAIPAFLQGMLALLFDRSTGVLNELTDYHPTVVAGVRQICRAFAKLSENCTPARVDAALRSFTQVERELSLFKVDILDEQNFLLVSRILWDPVCYAFEPNELVPHHGPGATADGAAGNGKYRWSYWSERLETYFPFLETAYSISAYEDGCFEDVTFYPPDQELPVKVTPVPKTLKGPRIIAIEPCCMQYAQQGLRDFLYGEITRSSLASGQVNFLDQSINREIALRSSRDGQEATLDLSDASDRVPLDLSIRMFDSNPLLKEMILACRSVSAVLPDGTLVSPLRKFASMGSALCFPIEAMYFYTICVLALVQAKGLQLSYGNVKNVCRDVFVYGDDITVPARYADTVVEYLQKYNCKVNVRKSFWTGKFRESCGLDAYDGQEVTPVYVRERIPHDRQNAGQIVSLVETSNHFYKRGYWHSASYLREKLERLLGVFPFVSDTSSGLGRHSFQQYRSIGRWSRDLQRFEVLCWVAEPVFRTDSLDGYAALQKALIMLERRPLGSSPCDDQPFNPVPDLDGVYIPPLSGDEEHLEHSVRHGAVALKRRWVPAY